MNVTSVGNIIGSAVDTSLKDKSIGTDRNQSFEALFQSALSMVKETNNLTNLAEQEEMKFALGYSDNTHDLQIAQQKANMSLQFTTAVRNKVLEAYKEIMNMQF